MYLRLRAAAALAVCSLVSTAISAEPTYSSVRGSRPDGRTITVAGWKYERDAFRFTLNGTLHLLQPAAGTTFGAVFIGQGSYELTPASKGEQRQLAIYAGDDKLVSLIDTFENATFFSTDLVEQAIKAAGAPKEAAPSPAAVDEYNAYLKRQRKDFTTNIHIRVLRQLLNAPPQPFFFCWVNGKKYPPALLVSDPLGADAIGLAPGFLEGGEETLMFVYDRNKGGAWYLSHLRSEIEQGKAMVVPPLVDAQHYLIDTAIAPNQEISATTELTFRNNTEGLRLLPLNLTGRLRLREVSFALAGSSEWKPAEMIQEDHEEDADSAVVFPAGLTAGEMYTLKVSYGGRDVLSDAGDGNYTVGARQNWYPNVGTFFDLATYELRFRNPQKMQIVAVGEELSNRVEGKDRLSAWKSNRPLRVAGFNYGNFKKLAQDDKDSGMKVEVFTNPGTPDIVREINRYLEAASEAGSMDPTGDGYMGPSHIKADTGRLAQSAMADGINTARVGNVYFGALPSKRVAITQQSQWNFGQSWPGLIYMPFLAFLDGTTRNTLGLNSAKDFVDNVGAHEFAHQWWGHHVGWRGYRDQWLSEGFSEFTAGLVVQMTGGWNKYNNFWEKKRRYILEKPRGANIGNDEAGPITQGWRLSNWRNFSAYDALVYAKGAYILHMLRMTMQGRGEDSDKAFVAMMKDFATTWGGKNPSTEDFARIVGKHATQTLNPTPDGRVDWFFNQWVYGTAIPRYESKLSFQDAGSGKYKVTGTITQSQVPQDFFVMMPIYVTFEKDSFAKLGMIPLVGSQTKPVEFEIALPKKPRGFTINHLHDVLAR